MHGAAMQQNDESVPQTARSMGLSRSTKRKFWLQVPAFTLTWLGVLFVSAGRLDWIEGWIYVGLYIAGMTTAGIVVRRYNPTLIEARANWRHSDTKSFDKVFIALFLPLMFLQLAVAGLDAVRYHWSSIASAWTSAGRALFVFSIALMAWPLAVNPFAESTVRIQTDRGHTVITWGPYRFIRHPMYTGAIVMFVATPLALGSLWTLTVTVAIVALFLWRTALEDRTLHWELPGYADYAARTRYRLFPGVW